MEFSCIAKIGGGLFLIHSTELLHSNIPDFCWMFVVSEVHRFEFARRNDDRGGAVKMCFQMLPPVFFWWGQDVSELQTCCSFWPLIYVICYNGGSLP